MKDSEINAVRKLLAKAREIHAQHGELIEEMNRVMNGEGGIADKLKLLEAHFDALWGVRYAGGEVKRYLWRYAIDRPNMKRLLRLLEPAEIQRRMVVYLKNDERFYTQARHPFGLFVSSINSHVDLTTIGAAVTQPDAVGCKHVPKCRSDQAHTKRQSSDMKAMFN